MREEKKRETLRLVGRGGAVGPRNRVKLKKKRTKVVHKNVS